MNANCVISIHIDILSLKALGMICLFFEIYYHRNEKAEKVKIPNYVPSESMYYFFERIVLQVGPVCDCSLEMLKSDGDSDFLELIAHSEFFWLFKLK